MKIVLILIIFSQVVNTVHAGWFGSLFRTYDNYTECMVVEEQRGASHESANDLCVKLAAEYKIECDTNKCLLKVYNYKQNNRLYN